MPPKDAQFAKGGASIGLSATVRGPRAAMFCRLLVELPSWTATTRGLGATMKTRLTTPRQHVSLCRSKWLQPLSPAASLTTQGVCEHRVRRKHTKARDDGPHIHGADPCDRGDDYGLRRICSDRPQGQATTSWIGALGAALRVHKAGYSAHLQSVKASPTSLRTSAASTSSR